jgi:1,4-dihydroxy-2-naphthoate octaprenyltransferase
VVLLAIVVSAALGRPIVLISIIGLLPATRASLRVLRGATGRELIAVLGLTARAQLLVGVLLSVTVWTW